MSAPFVLHHGDCRQVMAQIAAASVDAVVCDPPYELGFMGRSWDNTGVATNPAVWQEALRVAKPGAYLLAFGGTRTFHRLACAIEDAGWQLRDSILRAHTPEDCPWLMGWMYGSGFPKSRNGEWGGTALKPAWEPIVMARKPLAGTVEQNWREHGTGGLNIDGCRVPIEPAADASQLRTMERGVRDNSNGWGMSTVCADSPQVVRGDGRWPANLIHDGSDPVLAVFPGAPGQLADISDTAPSAKTSNVYGAMARRGEPSADSENEGAVGFKIKPGARRLDSGSAARFFKQCSFTEDDPWPHQESSDRPVRSAESPSSSCETCTAAEVAGTKTSGFKSGASPAIPACTGSCENCIPSRSHANADNSGNIATTQTTASLSKSNGSAQPAIDANINSESVAVEAVAIDQGKATRFLYCPKASKNDRNEGCEGLPRRTSGMVSNTNGQHITRRDGGAPGPTANHHPTVKPTDLMRYLCRLVTPPGGTVLDPFMGSGSTGKAAMLEGFKFIGIELDVGYIEIARARIEFARHTGHQPSLLEAA